MFRVGFEPMTSALEWSKKVRVLDLPTKRNDGFRTVNVRVGFRKIFFFINSYTEDLKTRVSLYSFAGASTELPLWPADPNNVT